VSGRPRRGKGRPGPRRPDPRRRKGGRSKSQRAPVRKLAAGVVRGVLEGRGAARTHVERAGERDDFAPRDVALLTELVYGTLRRLDTLDLLLGAAIEKGGLGRVDADVLAHLRVGAYQLVFLDHVPPAVAVSEAVAGAGRHEVRGFVNGVLRGLGRKVAGRVAEDAPPVDVPPTRRLPGREGGWVLLTEDLLPDPTADPAGWLAAGGSLPRAAVAPWVERLGLEEALEVVRAHDAPPPVTLRVNALRATRDALLERLAAEGVAARPGARPESIALAEALSAGGYEPLWEGLATVQDETAMEVAPLLEPRPGQRLVDLCAAPGGKATHLAELLRDEGRVDALDVDADRLARVDAAARRLGLSCVRTALADPDDPRPPEEPGAPPIDGALVDAPCSNTGVLRRRVELRHRLAKLDLPPLLALQARLLRQAADLVRPGGRVVYSTCSIEPAENEDQVRAFLAGRPGATLEEERSRLPRRGGGDGGYMARIRL